MESLTRSPEAPTLPEAVSDRKDQDQGGSLEGHMPESWWTVGSVRWRALAVVAVVIAGPPSGCGWEAEIREGAESPEGRGVDSSPWTLALSEQDSGTRALLQAVSPASRSVVWVSGHDGTYARTMDGGRSWRTDVMTGAENLQFRDVEAFDSLSAVLMSAGPGDLSRIYRTDDGGKVWRLQFQADDPAAFLDCMAFWDEERGLAYGDAVDEVPFILRTLDGGESWARVPAAGLPPALDGEGGFAASGTCLVTGEGGSAWIATGAGPRARVLLTRDWGDHWLTSEPPVVGGEASGLTTLALAVDGWGLALGGTIGADTLRTANVAATRSHGQFWYPAPATAMAGPVYGSALVELRGGQQGVVAVGPGGMDWTLGPDLNWRTADSLTYWAVAFATSDAGWAVGPEGRITGLAFQPQR